MADSQLIQGVDRLARNRLREAVIGYMNGTILTFEFDDLNIECGASPDQSVQLISRFLYSLHDDIIDHPISVTEEGWAALQRVVAFLSTDFAADSTWKNSHWPFPTEATWVAHEDEANDSQIPIFNPILHSQQIIHPWWDRLPAWVGLTLLAGTVLVIVLTLSRL